MSTVKQVRKSQRLLKRMARAPEEVVAKLDPAEREKLVTELSRLLEQARKVQEESELIVLVRGVDQLVESRPALARQFQMNTMRTLTEQDLDTMSSERQAQKQAAQIVNSMSKLHQGIKQELQKLRQRSDGDHGQTKPGFAPRPR